MKVNIKDISSCEKVLTIDVAQDAIKEEFDSFYAEVSKRAKIPGFRPGQAPKNVVALHFKKEAHDEVLKQLVSKSLDEAVKEKDLPVIGYPTIDQIEFNEQKLKFSAHVELRPVIKIEKYTELKLKRNIVKIDEKEIEDVLKQYQEAHGKFEAVENREAKQDDFVIADYRLEVDGKEIEKRDGEWFQIREKDYLEGFSKQLLGVKPGEERKVTINFPADYARKELANKKGTFLLNAKEIKEKKLPELTDDVGKEAGYQTLVELKDAIKTDLEHQKKQQSEVDLENGLFDELIKKSKFDVPAKMVERRQVALTDDAIQRMMSQGMPEEEVNKQKDKIKENFKTEADRQIRISFILDEIATRESIKVEAPDIEERFKQMAERIKRSVDEIKSFYQEKEERMESLALQIVNEKVIQWLKDKAVIEDVIKSEKLKGKS